MDCCHHAGGGRRVCSDGPYWIGDPWERFAVSQLRGLFFSVSLSRCAGDQHGRQVAARMFYIGDEKHEIGPGGLVVIPGGVTHWGEVIGDEPVLNLDIFTPKRPEYAP